nr:hypothetical protein [Desulfobulbaceae bacterium]
MSKNRAALDLGTNSFRMLIAEAKRRSFTSAQKTLCTVRLGEGISNQRLSTVAMNRGLETLATFKQQLTDRSIEIIACGTAVFRQVTNGVEFIKRAESLLGAQIQVLTPEQEAYLSRVGTLLGLNETSNTPCITIDAGGGSTELSISENMASAKMLPEDQWYWTSLPVGAVSLTETYQSSTRRTPADIYKMQQATTTIIHKGLSEWLLSFGHSSSALPSTPTLVASGGTATALACLDLGLKEYDAARVQGHILHRTTLAAMLKDLAKLTPKQANILPGLDNRRGEIIIAGLLILQTIADFWSCDQITVSDTGLLEGIFLAGGH